MVDMSTDPMPLETPISPEMNLYFFYKEVADDVDELERAMLEYLVSCGTSRGWFPSVGSVTVRFAEESSQEAADAAMRKLQRQRLLRLDGDGKVCWLLGGVTHEKTGFRAMTADHVPFHLNSALDVLTIAPMLQKSVTVQTRCAISEEPIEVEFDPEGHLVTTNPHEVTAFIRGWDGAADVAEALADSPLLWGNSLLREWQERHGDPAGMPLTEDTIRMVGTEMAAALAALYVRMSIR